MQNELDATSSCGGWTDTGRCCRVDAVDTMKRIKKVRETAPVGDHEDLQETRKGVAGLCALPRRLIDYLIVFGQREAKAIHRMLPGGVCM